MSSVDMSPSEKSGEERKEGYMSLWQIIVNLSEFAVDTVQVAFNVPYSLFYDIEIPKNVRD